VAVQSDENQISHLLPFTGIGSNKKAVNNLLHFLKNKNILTVKTGEKGADPRWSA
jgi:hypothetical protein